MTDNNHPITPPPEIIREWQIKIEYCSKRVDREAVVAKIFQLGADQELEACEKAVRKIWQMDHVSTVDDFLRELRAARRPKPPSLKEQAQRILVENGTTIDGRMELDPDDIGIIRRAIEALPD